MIHSTSSVRHRRIRSWSPSLKPSIYSWTVSRCVDMARFCPTATTPADARASSHWPQSRPWARFGERPRIDPFRSGYRRVMTAQLQDRRIAFLTANEGVEQIELTEPWEAVKRAGGTPVLVAPQVGKVQAFNHLDKADTFEASISASDADAGDYDGLVLPGGVANPDQLRTEPDAVRFVKDFFEAGT